MLTLRDELRAGDCLTVRPDELASLLELGVWIAHPVAPEGVPVESDETQNENPSICLERYTAVATKSLVRWIAGRRRPDFGSPRSRQIPDDAIFPVPDLRILRHLRPRTAEVSLRHIFGWVTSGCRSSSLNNAVPQGFGRTAPLSAGGRLRCPEGVCLPWSPIARTAFLFARVSVPSPVEPGLLHGPMSAILLLVRLSGARSARPLDGV